MRYEYFLLNILILMGPLALSFDRRVYFIQYYKSLLVAILSTMIPFLIWDVLVTGRHWWFNESYTLHMNFLGLPPGEWLFFVTVPYATLFIWQVFKTYFNERTLPVLKNIFWPVVGFFVLLSIRAAVSGREYTALAALAFVVSLVVDRVLKINLIQYKLFYWLLATQLVLMLIFNGYLTFRPVVLYNPQYQLDFRIGTIPIEDFFYGYALAFLNITLFERFKRKFNG